LYASGITVIEQVGEGLVPLIEAGKSNSEEMLELLKQYINPMLDQNIDYLVLGCTHYPYLIPQILTILPKDVKIIDSGMAVAQQTRSVLTHHKLINPGYKKGRVKAYSNRNVEVLRSILNNKFEVTSLDF
jgi:glutamate racemase